MFSIINFFLYFPVSIEKRFPHTLTLNREYRKTLAFFQALETKDILIVSDRPGQFTAQDFGAVNFAFAQENWPNLQNEYERKLFSGIYFIQRIEYDTNEPVSGMESPVSLDHHEIYLESQLTATSFLRISKYSP